MCLTHHAKVIGLSLSEEALDTYTKIFYEPQEFTKEEIEETTVIEFYTFE